MTHSNLPIITAHGNAAFLQAFHEEMLRESNNLYKFLSRLWEEYNLLESANNSNISLRLWLTQVINTIDNGLDKTVVYNSPMKNDRKIILPHSYWNYVITNIARRASILLNAYIEDDDSLLFDSDDYRQYSISPDCTIVPTLVT
jgi:hypothetical protein